MIRNCSQGTGAMFAFIGFALMLAMPAWAELGGNVSGVQADQEQMKGTRKVSTNAAYSVHEIQAATGTKVREFVSPAGSVFAVAWEGPSTPDLRQLLGQYFAQYEQAIQNRRPGRVPLVIKNGNLVVEAHGRMRSFSGRAYLPTMVPQGVAAESIR